MPRRLAWPTLDCLIPASSQQAGDRDVLVDCLPVQPEAADLYRLALLRRRVQEAREPGVRNAYGSSV